MNAGLEQGMQGYQGFTHVCADSCIDGCVGFLFPHIQNNPASLHTLHRVSVDAGMQGAGLEIDPANPATD
jgi:hypothetical protein